MFRPWNRTSPSTRANGIVSCIRLRQRNSVDFPHPDGPMIAVTWFVWKSSETSRTACVEPKCALSARVCIAGSLPGSSDARIEVRAIASVIGAPVTGPYGEPREDADHEDEGDQNQRARPRLGVPFV